MKRETLYIKDNDAWEKENAGKNMLKSAINDVANKQRAAIADWESANPNWASTESGKEEYIKLVRSVMKEVNDSPDENKIIKSIAKETIIDK